MEQSVISADYEILVRAHSGLCLNVLNVFTCLVQVFQIVAITASKSKTTIDLN